MTINHALQGEAIHNFQESSASREYHPERETEIKHLWPGAAGTDHCGRETGAISNEIESIIKKKFPQAGVQDQMASQLYSTKLLF